MAPALGKAFRRPLLLAGFLLPGIAGCFVHVAVEEGAAPPGTEVRLDLDASGVERLQLETGRRGRSVSGTLVQGSSDSVGIRAPIMGIDGEYTAGAGALEVWFPASEVRGVSVRRLSPLRTGLLVVGGAALGLATVEVVGGGSEGGGDTPPPLLLVRLPLPLFR